MRLLLAALAVTAVVVLGSLVAIAAHAEYCPAGEVQRRLRAYKAYTKQTSRQRYRYFQQTRNRRLRAAFVRKQKAQQKALLRALLRCN
jgi:hypothetical protein